MTSLMEKIQMVRFNLRMRIVITVIFLVIALGVTILGVVSLRIDASEAQKFRDDIMGEFSRLNDPRFIFGNNLIHALVMFVPAVGPIWGSYVLFSTGNIIAVISIAEGVPPVLTFFLLFLTPVFWLEFGVYSLAMAQSVILTLQMLRNRGKNEVVRTCMLVTICALILLLAAMIEWIMINMI